MKTYLLGAGLLALLMVAYYAIAPKQEPDSVALARSYIEENIQILSPEPEVLGGTFYVTNIIPTGPNTLRVSYEDGHIALEADATYSTDASGAVQIESFTLVDNEEEPAIDVEPVAPRRTVDLSNQNLVKVPEAILKDTTIESLDLSHNNLTGALPAEIRQLKELRILNLSRNQFTGLPAELGQLSKLEVLNVSDNPITGLPYELGNLSNLKVLDLRGTSYSQADLEVIKSRLPENTRILTE